MNGVDLVGQLNLYVNDQQAVFDLRRYMSDDSSSRGFSGRWFERFGGGGDRTEVRNIITAEDLVALTALSIEVPAWLSWRLLHEDSEPITQLLEGIPSEVDLWDAMADDVGPRSCADDAWHLICGFAADPDRRGQRWVTAGKLLARKRPRLIPILDNDVKRLLGLPPAYPWWTNLREVLLEDEELRQRLIGVREATEGANHLSILRVLDIILWMRAEHW